ncbi:hypothetical protein KNT59_gp061 [Klebsiella phage KPV15]|uniref:Uncharacterized protein n=1 Tax=Klebsiella phage KPV15 TaxID=1913572 RepID=A0A1J0MHA6_9CAUD|nr:hypothetical protein KNT59_gp061 [Klebsiella phage KPV15]APD20417.1 hypothetical protein [Klebsiella phage KPV15]
MIVTPMTVQDIRQEFADALLNKEFVIDKTGVKTIEIVGASFIADENLILAQLMMDTLLVNLSGINLKVYSLKIFRVKPQLFGKQLHPNTARLILTMAGQFGQHKTIHSLLTVRKNLSIILILAAEL